MENYKCYRVWYQFPGDDYQYATQIDATSEQTARERVQKSDPDITVTKVELLS